MYTMTANMMVFAMVLIQVKHLVIDWIWQPPYECMNKHLYGHWGGIRHALKNAIGTGLALYIGCLGHAPWLLCLWLAAVDFVVHYHIDWSKMNINRKMGWGPTTHEQFWWLTGADQFAHQATYLALLYYVSTSLVYKVQFFSLPF